MTAWAKFLQRVFVVLGFCCASLSLHAATQGTTSDISSTGRLDVTVTTGLVARISGLNDINFGAWSGGGPMTATDNLCIGRSGVGFFAQGNFRMRFDGDGSPGNPQAFTLTNGVDLLYYDVMFNDATGVAGQVGVTAGTLLNNQSGFGFWQTLNVMFGCAVENASVTVNLSHDQLIAVPAGNYTGTLTLLLIPE